MMMNALHLYTGLRKSPTLREADIKAHKACTSSDKQEQNLHQMLKRLLYPDCSVLFEKNGSYKILTKAEQQRQASPCASEKPVSVNELF